MPLGTKGLWIVTQHTPECNALNSPKDHRKVKKFGFLRKRTTTWVSGLNPHCIGQEQLLESLLSPTNHLSPLGGDTSVGRYSAVPSCHSPTAAAQGEQPLGKMHTRPGLWSPLCHGEDGCWNPCSGKMLEDPLHCCQGVITKTKHQYETQDKEFQL